MYNSEVEFANEQRHTGSLDGLRAATRADAEAITRLLQTAVYQHLHVDWYLPGDWLGSPGFVVLPQPVPAIPDRVAKFVGIREKFSACLAVTSDVMPVAWVRVAALAEQPKAQEKLFGMLAKVETWLRSQQVTQIAWLVTEGWPQTWLEEMGFAPAHELETFVKEDTAVPAAPILPDLAIRPVSRDDFEACAALEVAAFAPLWRQSAHALKLAYGQSLSFDTAWIGDELVAYQLSARSEVGAHLVRMTVQPGWQGKGVGTALLVHALRGYHQRALMHVSLNTQVDNTPSQALYQKFGFTASGFRLPIWTKQLSEDPV